MSYRKYLMADDVPPSELYKTVKIDTDSDTISRRVAISAICNACGKIDCDEMDKCEKLQLPPANCSEFPNSSDTISRQQAIDTLRGYLVGKRCPDDGTLTCRLIENEVINKLPPAQPERIRGHWIESNGLNILMKKFIEKGETWRVCDKCGAGFMIGYQHESDKIYHETFHNFCPKCGAEMEVTT